ncbi:MAG TPA: TetR/AcrR family transcriptional regulator [Phytomonospora sp.]
MERNATERGREVRRGMLAAAVELITELGWNAVSTRLLAERAGVRPGLVHYHFASLPALLREAAVGAMGALADTSPLAEVDDVDEGLALFLGVIDADGDGVSRLFSETYLAATRDEELRRGITGLIAGFNDGVADWLARAGHPAPRETAPVLTAALDGLALHKALNPSLDLGAAATVLRAMLKGDPS